MMLIFRVGDELKRDRIPEWLRSFLFRSFYYDTGTDRTGLNVYKKATVLKSEFYNVFYEQENKIVTVKDVAFELNGRNIIIAYP